MRNEHIISIEPSLCTRCGMCRDDCPDGVIVLTDESAEYTGQYCVKCGHCVAICPQGAVSITGYDEEPEEIDQFPKIDPDVLLSQMKSRRSMRQFTEKDVSQDDISKIIEAGRYTPTGGNKQRVSYAIIRENKDECERIAISSLRKLKPLLGMIRPYVRNLVFDDNFLFKGAPAVIVIKSTDPLDGALAASTMELMAQSLGLGVLYSGFFTRSVRRSRRLKRLLSVAPHEKIVTTLVIGHPAVHYQRTAQRESAITCFR